MKNLQAHQISLIKEIKTEEFIENGLENPTYLKMNKSDQPSSELNKKSQESNNLDESSVKAETILEDWKIQEESVRKENYKNIAESIISATHCKNFEINLDDVMILKSGVSNIKEEEKDLSKRENHDNFFEFNKFDDKINFKDKEKQKITHKENQNYSSPTSQKNSKQTLKMKILSPKMQAMHIRVSFITEKKNIVKKDTNFDETKSKRESKLRRLRNFSFKNTHILVVDDKYFLDSFFPLFSIVRYTSKTNPKMKRILLLALTFQDYMLFSAILYCQEVSLLKYIFFKG